MKKSLKRSNVQKYHDLKTLSKRQISKFCINVMLKKFINLSNIRFSIPIYKDNKLLKSAQLQIKQISIDQLKNINTKNESMKKINKPHKLDNFLISTTPNYDRMFYCVSTIAELKHGIYCYKIEAEFVHLNGDTIRWPSTIQNQILAKLLSLTNQIIKSRFTFRFESNRLILVYKKSIFRKSLLSIGNKEECQSFISQKKSQKKVKANIDPSTKLFENQNMKQRQIFQRYIAQLYVHVRSCAILAGIQIQKIPICLNKIKTSNKTSYEKYIKQTLKFRQILTCLSKKSLNLNFLNICQQNMEVNFSEKTKQTQQISGQITEELQKIFKKLLIKKQNKKQNNINTNLYVIKNIKQQNCNLTIVGGVSNVEKIFAFQIIYQIIESNQSNCLTWKQYNKFLAKKMVKNKCASQIQQNNLRRFKHQLDIVEQINTNKHYKFYMPNYFCKMNVTDNGLNKQNYYLEWYQMSLSFFLQKYSYLLKMQDKIFLCIQIVLIAMDLHRCGIVHRDLKPSNFLVDVKIKNGIILPKLKIIDFSDSMAMKGNGGQVKVGQLRVFSTSAYCPLQSSTMHQNYLTQGLIKPQIDYWSIGIMIYQIFYGIIPISYSTSTSHDIHALWKYEFNQYMYLNKQTGVENINNVVSFLTYQLVKFNPQERLPLSKVLAILLCVNKYYVQLKKHFSVE